MVALLPEMSQVKVPPRSAIAGLWPSGATQDWRISGITPCGSGLFGRIAALYQLDIARYACVAKATALHPKKIRARPCQIQSEVP